MEERKVDAALIASGSGTDADSIMSAYNNGFIPNIDLRAIISTKHGAGCIEKAINQEVGHVVVENKGKTPDSFNDELRLMLESLEAKLVFLVGCVVKVYPIEGVAMYNIHPADPHKHGGDGMYGLEVHRRVILEIIDKIKRGKAKLIDKFYTLPTIHEVAMEYDSGEIIVQARVEVPIRIIAEFIGQNSRGDSLDIAASNLQKHVLPYEWIMLPAAVQMAAKKIIDERGA